MPQYLTYIFTLKREQDLCVSLLCLKFLVLFLTLKRCVVILIRNLLIIIYVKLTEQDLPTSNKLFQ